MSGAASETRSGRHVDFDLHGIVGVRLVDAEDRDVRAVTRQIGPLVGPLGSEPDITVRFVDELADRGPLTYAGYPEAGASGNEFVLLRGKDGVPARTILPMDAVGSRCDIICERRAGHVPHLLAIINMTALAKGVLPLHASAFVHEGKGVLVTGWAKGGKTETLLAFAAHGAHYVGDEWIYLTPDGLMHGVPEPIRLWHWHVAQLPSVRSALPAATRARLALFPAVGDAAATVSRAASGLPASIARRAAPIIRRQAYVQLPPARLFGEDAIALHASLDHVFLVESHVEEHVVAEPVPGSVVAATMAASLEEERSPFLQAYRQFRFLFPERRSAVTDAATTIEAELLARYLSDRAAHLLRHPYPVRLETLVVPVRSAIARPE